MSVSASFSFPTATLYGPGSLSELPARLQNLGVSRPLVVTDPGLLPTSAFKKLEAVLGAVPGGWALFSGVCFRSGAVALKRVPRAWEN